MSYSKTHGSPPETRRGRGAGRATGGSSEDLPDFARLYGEHADEWISCVDSEARFLFVNPALSRALGYSAPELSSLRVWDLSPTTPESWPRFWSEIRQGLSLAVVANLRTRAGGILPAHFDIQHITLRGTEYLLCCGREHPEPPERVALRISERALAQLSARLLEMQDEERRRIARELHDTTGQNLAALSINLSMILTTCALDPHARETLEECTALADSSVKEIRTLSYLLHPPLLDELGLASALRAYCERYAERTGLEVELDLPGGMPRLPQAIEIALFRIVQEGLTNIHRHSGSSTAILRLKYQPKGVELEVADHGRGLPPGTSASRIGVGIAGMRERARQLGGRLTIGSSETGTTLRVALPLPPEITSA